MKGILGEETGNVQVTSGGMVNLFYHCWNILLGRTMEKETGFRSRRDLRAIFKHRKRRAYVGVGRECVKWSVLCLGEITLGAEHRIGGRQD